MGLSPDPNKQQNQIANLNKRPEAPNASHGLYPFMRSGFHKCNRCIKKAKCDRYQQDANCSYLGEYQENIENTVMDLEYIDEQDRLLAQLLAKEMSAILLCEMYFSEVGIIVYDKRKLTLSSQPLFNDYNKLKNSSRQTMQALGLGPAARTKLDMDKVKVAKTLEEIGSNSDPEGTDFLDD